MRLSLDGKVLDTGQGQTILELARERGIPIPSLCYHEGLGAYGACRLCLVEVIEGGAPGIHSACTLPASQGLKVLTAGRRVLAARRITAELLLARAPEAPAIRRIAAQCGVEETDLAPRNERCILCGRCVRACAQINVHAINFARRGMMRHVASPFGKASKACVACRACFNVCPTGAIESTVFPDRVYVTPPHGEAVELERAACMQCGKPYATNRAWDHIQRQQPEHLRIEHPLCPSCRRNQQLLRLTGGGDVR